MKIRTLTAEDVTFTLTLEPEDTPIRGNALASGDEEQDRDAEDWVRCQLENGNEWAWCCVKVTAYWEGPTPPMEGVAYLGCCSYADEADFKAGEYKDMCQEALDDLNAEIARVAKSLPWEES